MIGYGTFDTSRLAHVTGVSILNYHDYERTFHILHDDIQMSDAICNEFDSHKKRLTIAKEDINQWYAVGLNINLAIKANCALCLQIY